MTTLVKRMVFQIVVLLMVAVVCALGANAIHRDGIVLTRNYFKLGAGDGEDPVVAVNAVSVGPKDTQVLTAAPNDAAVEPEEECLRKDEHDLTLACFDFVFGAWEAMQAGDTSVVFVDARTEEAYVEGHIAGAVLVDHYRQDRYLPPVKDRLDAAGMIFVYCSGSCEDSRYLATALIYDHHIAPEAIFLYEGGITEWEERQQPVTEGLEP